MFRRPRQRRVRMFGGNDVTPNRDILLIHTTSPEGLPLILIALRVSLPDKVYAERDLRSD